MTVSTPVSSAIKPYLVHLDLRPLGESETLITTPGGTLFEVAAETTQVARWLELCNGENDLAAIEAKTGKGFLEIVEALIEDGCVLRGKPAVADATWAHFDGELKPESLQHLNVYVFASERLATAIVQSRLLTRLPRAVRHDLDAWSEIRESLDAESVVLLLMDQFDSEPLLEVDDWCRENDITWASFHLDRGKGWLGPLIIPGATADYKDLLDRRLCCADNRRMFEAVTAKPVEIPATRNYSNAELAWMLGRFFFEIERYAVGASCHLLSTELEADPKSLAMTSFAFLPMPHRKLAKPFLTSAPTGSIDSLINARSGLIIQSIHVKHHPSVPETLVTMQAQVTNIAAVYDAANDVIVGGSSFGDQQQALLASVGETIERYCGNYIPGEELRRATYNDIVAGGEHALDPDSLVLFDEAMYREQGCPMMPFTRETEVLWVRGESLTRKIPAWLPISLVYVNWYTALPEEPITNYMNFPGIAAGQNDEHAIVSAIEEIVERDATMIWWMNRQPLPALQLPSQIESVWTPHSLNEGQRAWAIHLDNEFGIPVVAGILENTKDQLFNIGFAARPTASEATLKAWTEALTLQEGSRDMDDPNGLLRTSVEEWGLIEVPYKPWRQDRKYLDDYRKDFRDVSDLLQQQQVNLDPRCLEQVRHWVDLPRIRSLAELPTLPDRSLVSYQSRIEGRGFEIFYKDITTNDVALTGLKAARVIIPGLVPNTPAAFPPLGKRRVQQVPVDLGWRKKQLEADELNYAPLPHA
jgi:ribosomal protein S12 methylthiotransferase accessory factor